jgi:RNA polymerase sigma factor (sigma-70 family)
MADGFPKTAPVLSAPASDTHQTLDDLYRRYRAELRGYVERTFGMGPPEPDDVAQTAFMKFTCYVRHNPVENPRAFLYATVRNIVLDYRRRTRVVKTHAHHEQRSDIAYEISPERVLLNQERLALLAAALERMPKHRRRMVLMNRIHNLSCEEIGRRLGVSTSTVQKQIVQGIADCLRHLEQSSQCRGDPRGKGGNQAP